MEKINGTLYSNQIYSNTGSREFTEKATEAAFLLGGIGTGNVSLGSRGDLRDWEIFNHPNKGLKLPNKFFSIWAKEMNQPSIAKVLEGKVPPPHSGSHGYYPNTAAGLPRMSSSALKGEYPIANVVFKDNDLPVDVELEAYTPFIPLNTEDSGIPCAILKYKVKNKSEMKTDVAIAGSLYNPVGGIEYDEFSNYQGLGGLNVNEVREEKDFKGLYMYSKKYDKNDLKYGNVALTTTNKNVTFKPVWLRGRWFDEMQEFWDDFSKDGKLNDLGYTTPSTDRKSVNSIDSVFYERQSDTGSLSIYETLNPQEEKEFLFLLTWYFPNRINGWSERHRVKEKGREITQNYYSKRFNSSWDVTKYIYENFDRLKTESFKFHHALFSSTLPNYVLEAISSNITVLRSPTCMWLKDGHFLGYEGCFDNWGCCDGNCTHVWGYAQTLAFLFPELERNMRKTEFLEELEEDGHMNFRAVKMFDSEWIFQEKKAPAAVDGQMGSIMRVYREWKISGDKEFLDNMWPHVKKALTFALVQWDTDGDLVLDGIQHNTYDIEFHGPNPLSHLFFLGALRAVEEMAKIENDLEMAEKCKNIFDLSRSRTDDMLWNGEYYIQKINDVDEVKYQHGEGCLSDQLLAQQIAHILGLGYLLPEEHVNKAIQSIFKYNFRDNFSNHVNCQRTYVMDDEKGLVLCSWPNGGRPKFPFIYSDEVWTGVEYQVATHLIYEGFVDEGLTIVKAIKERHDGIKRNPWNEVECGHHYARSMASWGLLLSLSGFNVDMGKKEISFNPVINKENFSSFWSTGTAWGTYHQEMDEITGEIIPEIKVLYGDLSGVKVKTSSKELTL
ncbi:GH116 family glycosyl-hydrolase [Scopulibacillus cellulosilyticus]|uniref:GH116 family glycosyl-hydrolase n=1 Tax=Scopulibacillus cellulosilyticus TaxID=2665665 RepID=A0ABW2PZB4_9BACL